jgi:hypothetical protein
MENVAEQLSKARNLFLEMDVAFEDYISSWFDLRILREDFQDKTSENIASDKKLFDVLKASTIAQLEKEYFDKKENKGKT